MVEEPNEIIDSVLKVYEYKKKGYKTISGSNNTFLYVKDVDKYYLEKQNKQNSQNPSIAIDCAWIYAYRKDDKYPKNVNGGKWLLFEDISRIDDLWKKIKKATEDGLLGGSSKVATAISNSNVKVICVYTYDWTDEKDVMRIRSELKRLGIEKKIPYKSDEDTRQGKYTVIGDTKISKYFC